MPSSPRPSFDRRIEAERLIMLARRLLDGPDEEMAALFLDQAVETLRALAEGKPPQN
jgi:hypothetical protein